MLKGFIIILSLMTTLVSANSDFSELNQQVKQKTQVLVLGSQHLANIDGPIDLSELHQVINVFAPSSIAVESLRGEDIIAMINGSDEYQQILQIYVGHELLYIAKQQQQYLSLSPAESIQNMRLLAAQYQFTTQQRIKLIRLAIAGYYPDTAALHWLQLSDADKQQFSSTLQTYLNNRTQTNNERITIATALAIKMNHNLIYPIDDHLDKDMYQAIVEQLMPSYQSSKSSKALLSSEYILKPLAMQKQAIEQGTWLALYQWLNSREFGQQVLNQEWHLFIDQDLAVKPALARVALWEIRNLNIVSNIMRVVANDIGGRIIVVIGASHKVFLEQYLSQMIGVELVQFSDYISH